MNTIGPLIFLTIAFGSLLAIRIIFLLIIRSGETTKDKRLLRPGESQPKVIKADLFASNKNENTP